MNTDGINFGAIQINKKPILINKYNNATKQFEKIPTNFIRLDSYNEDIKAVEAAASAWTNALYIKKIATASHWMKTLPIEIYALTIQKDNFDKLEHEKILGFAEMRNDDNNPRYKWLYRLQVKPEATNVNNNNKIYNYVGTNIIKSLKKIYKNISLFSIKNPNIEKFYKNNGFIEDYRGEKHYVWTSNLITRFKIYLDKLILDLRY